MFLKAGSVWPIFRRQLAQRPPILVVPRLHTNLSGWMEALLRADIPTEVLVARVAPLENHLSIKVHEISGWVPRFRPAHEPDDWVKFRWFIPSVFELWGRMRGASGRTLVVRDRTPLSVLAYWCFRLRGGSEAYLYVQERSQAASKSSSLSPAKISRIFRKKIAQWMLPKATVSPVWSLGNSFSLPENFPFFIESRFFEVGEECVRREPVRKPNLLVVGKFRPYKNLLGLITWLASNPEILDNVNKVTISGECIAAPEKRYLDDVVRLLRNRRVARHFELVVNTPSESMHLLYEKHDIFLLPSIDEVASVSVLEAAASGLAVLTPASNGTACYFGGFSEQIFSWENTEDLKARIMALVTEPTVLISHRLRSFLAVQPARAS